MRVKKKGSERESLSEHREKKRGGGWGGQWNECSKWACESKRQPSSQQEYKICFCTDYYHKHTLTWKFLTVFVWESATVIIKTACSHQTQIDLTPSVLISCGAARRQRRQWPQWRWRTGCCLGLAWWGSWQYHSPPSRHPSPWADRLLAYLLHACLVPLHTNTHTTFQQHM